MAVSKIGSTTTVYRSTSTTRVSSTSPSSSTTSTSRTKSTVSSASTTSRTISYSSATAKATSSTTVTYSGSSSTAKVSSTTSTRTTATKSNKVSVSASTTASTTAKASSTTAKVASASNTSKVSTTVASASNTSKVSMTVASVSNTSKASISVSSTTANISSSTTVPTYAYLAHLGGEALKRAEEILVMCGYDDKRDGNFDDALVAFKNDVGLSAYTTHSYAVATRLFEVGEKVDSLNVGDNDDKICNVRGILEKTGFIDSDKNLIEALEQFKYAMGMDGYDIFDTEVISEVEKMSDLLSRNENFAMQLKDLGFFNPNSRVIEATSVQADSAPSDIYKSIENFCRVYGVEYDTTKMDEIMAKIDEVHSYYTEILNSEKTDAVLKELGEYEGSQKINFSKSWTFLKLGMKFDDELTSAVLGNWYIEGAFSETNREDGDDGYSLDNSKDYAFCVGDGYGFGIMQWTDSERKTDFLSVANEMKSGVGNINVQFALFKTEIGEGGSEHSNWEIVIGEIDAGKIGEYSEAKKSIYRMRVYAGRFLVNIERAGDQSIGAQNYRAGKAEIIYGGMVE